jgi:uncharacterized Zn finger protein (UPF0148 family)
MIDSLTHDTQLTIVCPGCGNGMSSSFRQIEREGSVTCPVCGNCNPLSAAQLVEFLMEEIESEARSIIRQIELLKRGSPNQ